MIKPTYKKGMDFIQLAHSAVEAAINAPLSKVKPEKDNLQKKKYSRSNHKHKKSM